PIEEIRARQAAVAELRPRLDLREDLALLGAEVAPGVDLGRLGAWGAEPPILASRPTRLAALALAVATGTFLVLWASGGPRAPFLAALFAQILLCLRLRARVARVLGPVEDRARELSLFAGLLDRLEREDVVSPLLRSIRDAVGGQ